MEEAAARGVQIFLALSGAYLLALWFALAVWAYRDIGNRSQSVVTQILSTLLVVLFSIPGALLYLLLRPKATLDEVYQRSLEEEYLIQDLQEFPVCQSCQRPVEEDWVLCPNCQATLKEPCPSCERLIQVGWLVCPYCGQNKSERMASIREGTSTVGDRYIERGAGSFRTIGAGAVREIGAPVEPEQIATPADPGALSAGEFAASDETTAASDPEPIRLFDRRRTRMRNGKPTESEPEESNLDADTEAAVETSESDETPDQTSPIDEGVSTEPAARQN